MGKVLACIDGSSYHHSVCAYAAWAAKRTDSTVEVLHVLGRRETSTLPPDFSGNLAANVNEKLLQELVEHDAVRARLAQQRGRVILDQAKATLREAGIDAETRLRSGGLVETLRELEPDARLVVIGKRGEASDFASGHLGSNLERVVRTSARPVLVASRAFQPVDRFLIAYDGGPSAERAVDLVASDPLLRGLEGHILTVGEPDAMLRGRLDSVARRLRLAGIEAHAALEDGHPESVIASYAERHDIHCIVMGAYGHSRIRNLIIGSTTTAMVRAAHVPILMVR